MIQNKIKITKKCQFNHINCKIYNILLRYKIRYNNYFCGGDFMLNIIRNIFNVIKHCFLVCFIGTILLFCLNKVAFRLSVAFSYYALYGALVFLAVSTMLLFINRKTVFSKANKKSTKDKNTKTTRTTTRTTRSTRQTKSSRKTTQVQGQKKTVIKRKRKIS